jgi:hypothetical protein
VTPAGLTPLSGSEIQPDRCVAPEASGLRFIRPLLNLIQPHHRAHRLLLRVDDLVGLEDHLAVHITHLVIDAIETRVHFRSQRSNLTAKATNLTAQFADLAIKSLDMRVRHLDLLSKIID